MKPLGHAVWQQREARHLAMGQEITSLLRELAELRRKRRRLGRTLWDRKRKRLRNRTPALVKSHKAACQRYRERMKAKRVSDGGPGVANFLMLSTFSCLFYEGHKMLKRR